MDGARDETAQASEPSFRALDENADKAARKAAALRWPPVAKGEIFNLFVDDLNAEQYSSVSCSVRMGVVAVDSGEKFVLVCHENGCTNKHFGTSTTSAPYHAAKHLRKVHQPKLLLSRACEPAKRKLKPQQSARSVPASVASIFGIVPVTKKARMEELQQQHDESHTPIERTSTPTAANLAPEPERRPPPVPPPPQPPNESPGESNRTTATCRPSFFQQAATPRATRRRATTRAQR